MANKKEHPLFRGLPAHVQKLRQKADADKRAKDRKDFMERIKKGNQ